MSVLGVILAGGLSTRMRGKDKSLMPLVGLPLIGHALNRLSSQVDQIIINTNGNHSDFDSFGLPIVSDSIGGFLGPLSGILAGMDYAAECGYSHLLTVAADTPFFPNDLCQRLLIDCCKINIAKTQSLVDQHNLHPTFGLWDVGLRENLRTALIGDMRKVMGFVKKHEWRSITWIKKDYDPFFNINTPEDMENAKIIFMGIKK